MSEKAVAKTTTSSDLDSTQGRTSIADTVVSKIAGIATREVSGVYALGGNTARAVGAIRERIPGSSTNHSQGISVEVGENADTGATVAEQVASATLGVPGVAGLHAGSFGEVATYLPGRRVTGVRLRDGDTEVHVVATMGTRLRDLADAVRSVVSPLVDTPVRVVVEDVVPDGTTAS